MKKQTKNTSRKDSAPICYAWPNAPFYLHPPRPHSRDRNNGISTLTFVAFGVVTI